MSAEAVARIHSTDPALVRPKEALGISIQVDLGSGRVCTMQTYVPAECSKFDLNQMLDKMTEAGARQRAAYKIEELERDLVKLEQEHRQQAEDLESVDKRHAEEQAKRLEEIAKATKTLANYDTVAREDWEKSGRRGEFELKGKDKANADRVRTGAENNKAAMLVAEEEKKKALGEIQKTMLRRQELIDKTKTEIARCRETVAAGLKE